MHALLPDLIAVCREAGDVVMSFYRSALEVREKSADNPVTAADLASDRLLHERLTNLLPEAGWLSEETADNPDRLARRLLWCVDPVDGTKEFILGIPEFAVSVALVDAGQPVLAVVCNPAADFLCAAAKGHGCHLNGRPVSVSRHAVLDGAGVDASRSERKRGEFAPFEERLQLRTMGSVAYKLARVAAGVSDATWSRGPKHEWDVCAGALLVAEAGGVATDLSNRPMRFNQPFPKVNGIIADNGHLHNAVVAAIAPFGAARTDPSRH
jgi:myo-inositol-1(or 4)-monophosphatase